MFRYVRVHLIYLLNRMIISILIIGIILLILSILVSSGVMDGQYMLDMNRNEYERLFFEDSLLIVKILSVMLSIFITAILNSDSAVNFSKYIIDNRQQKWMLFFSKVLTLFIVMVIVILVSLSIYIFMTYFFTPFDLNLEIVIKAYVKLFLLVIFYISLTNMLMTFSSTILLTLFPLALFWSMEINANIDMIKTSNLLKFLFQYIPHPYLAQNNICFYGVNDIYYIVIIGIIWGNSLYFVKKPIN